MSLSAIMNTALTGLFTNQSALRVTSSNIANVNTPGYAREVVRLEPLVNGSYAGGVKLADVERIVDRFLEASVLKTQGQASRYEVERQFHDRIQSLLGRPDSSTSLAGRMDSMFEKIGAAAQDPSKTVLRQDAIAGFEDFATEISRLSDEIQLLRTDAGQQIAERVANANALLKRIESLNPLIVREVVLGNPTGPLAQQRADALNELSKLVDIKVHDQPDGSVHVTTTTGTVLLGGARYELKYSAPGIATAETVYPPITLHVVDPTSQIVSATGTPLDGALSGGEIMGLLNLRDKVLPDMASELGTLSGSMIEELNAIHNANTSVPAPAVMTGKNTGLLGTDAHGFTGQTQFVVTANDGTIIDSVTIDFSAYTTINDVIAAVNTGLSGNGTMSLVNGVMTFSADGAGTGVALVDNPNNASNRAGKGFSHFFGLNDLLQAKVPTSYATGFTGTDAHGFSVGSTINFDVIGGDNRVLRNYTLTIPAGDFDDIVTALNDPAGLGQYMTFSLDASGQLVSTPKAGFSNVNVHVKADSTSRGSTSVTLSNLFGIGDRYTADQASAIKVRDVVSKTPQNLALAKLDYGVVPGQIALTVSNNLGAQALQSLELKVLNFGTSGSIAATKMTLSQYGAAFLGNLGLLANQASSREADAKALFQDIQNRYSDVSGVNLDEEMSNMIMYQNSYNAAARVITTAREMYDILLGIV